jgi:hypothetical protein
MNNQIGKPVQWPVNSLSLLCGLVVCTAILMLGIDIWFRNEAGAHLIWFRNHPGFWQVLDYPGMISHYRPVAFLMLSVVYHLFGPNALPFVITNFIGFLLTMVWFYLLIRHESGDTVAYISIVALLPFFNHVLYHPFNALHGIFYSWDVGWFCLALYLFIKGMEAPNHRVKYLVWAAVVSLIALGTHAFSGLTLAIVFVIYLSYHTKLLKKSPWIAVLGIVIPIALVAMIPFLEPYGEKLLKAGPPLLPRITDRFSLIARIVIISYTAPPLVGGTVQTVIHCLSKKRPVSPLWAIASGVVAYGLIVLIAAPIIRIILLFFLIILLVIIILKIREYRIFALMGLLGIAHYFLVRGESSNYLRFLVFGITPIMVFGLVKAGESLLLRLKLPVPAHKSQSKWILVLTVLALFSIGLGLFDVPGFRSPVQKIRYLVHLSQTFHDVLYDGTKLIPQNARGYFFSGRSREEEIATMYTRAHLFNLQPAKSFEYHHYFDLVGRQDIKFKNVESGVSLSPGETIYIFAFNIFEILWTQTKFPTAKAIYHIQKGRAEAAIYSLSAPEHSSLNLLEPFLIPPSGELSFR